MRLYLLLLVVLLASHAMAQPRGPLVVISIDGFNRELYQTDRFQAPNIRNLARRGASAEAVYPVFPSYTYPNHTSIATGCRPARHGIHTNVKLNSKAWYWDSSNIAVPTLWTRAKQEGLRVALLSWPVSVGANVDFNIPEIFSVKGANDGTTPELIEANSTPGLLKRFQVVVPSTFPAWDEETAKVAKGLLKEEHLDLLMIHLIQCDNAQHAHGPYHPEVEKAFANADRIVGEIAEAAGPGATIALVGDHGFQPYKKFIYLNKALKKAGLADKAVVKVTGGSAAVYTESEAVEALLNEDFPLVERVVSEEELRALEAFPGAKFALTSEPGAIFSKVDEGAEELEETRGQHGHLAEKVPTGFVVTGPGITPGTRLGEMEIIHVGATLAHLLGVTLPQAQGRSVLVDR